MKADKKDGPDKPASPSLNSKHPETNEFDRGNARGGDVPTLNKRLKARDPIDEGLRRLFQEVVEEPIPAEFLELLEKIDEKARMKDDPS